MSKIFTAADTAVGKVEHPASAAPPTEIPPSAPAEPSSTTTVPSGDQTTPPAQSVSQPVDVEAVLSGMAARKGGGNWQTSIVDLLKLLDLDSSLSARKELAGELNVHVGTDGSAEENIALHKAVMQKLADNGGKVPESLKG